MVRVSARDRLPVLDVVYYVTPPMLIAAGLGASGILWLSAGRRAFGAASVLLAVALAGVSAYPVPGRPAAPRKGDLRLLFWNVGRGLAGWSEIARTVQADDFDIMGLVEARNDADFWRGLFPGAGVATPGRGLVLVVEGTVEPIGIRTFGRRSRIASFDVVSKGRPVRVHLVDLEPGLLSRRGPLIREVARAALEPSPAPNLIMGDFNTPHDSVWLEALRSRFVNAHEIASSTPLPTWPSPVPLISIDQIWVDRRMTVRAARRELGWLSDHARLYVAVSEHRRGAAIIPGATCGPASARRASGRCGREKASGVMQPAGVSRR